MTSTAPYAGKSGLALALVRELEDRGLSTAYFKPLGSMPVTVDGVVTDQDAFYVNERMAHPAPIDAVCPVVAGRSLVEHVLAEGPPDFAVDVRRAFDVVSKGKDAVVAEGPGTAFQGLALGLSACEIADALDARVLVVDTVEGVDLPDDVLGLRDCLGDRLAGVVFNRVHESRQAFVRDRLTPFLTQRGIEVFGCMPFDPALSSVSVSEIVEGLGGTVLVAEDRLDEQVEAFMVGAMGQDKALRFFRRKARKAVITGGDRADVQLAALETSTRAIILTGNLPPSSLVLARADELGIPMILVDMDTLTAVERMESLMGHVRLHDPVKADRIREMFTADVDIARLLAAFGL